jgi:hypothetical protein
MSNRVSTFVNLERHLSDLKRQHLCYLATPYSKFPGGMHEAYIAACQLAGQLISNGVKVFCPIAHSHVLCEVAGLDPTSHALWNEQNYPFLHASTALIVAKLPSWETSVGIDHEIKDFRLGDVRGDKVIHYMRVLHEDDRP